MPNNGPTAKCYPDEEQYERWKKHADEAGMSVSEFIASMVEAGHKTFSVEVQPDESNIELRRERNELVAENERLRDRISALEDAMHRSEIGVIKEHVRDNPGATWEEIHDKVTFTASDRVIEHLETLEGTVVTKRDGGYYPIREVSNGSE